MCQPCNKKQPDYNNASFRNATTSHHSLKNCVTLNLTKYWGITLPTGLQTFEGHIVNLWQGHIAHHLWTTLFTHFAHLISCPRCVAAVYSTISSWEALLCKFLTPSAASQAGLVSLHKIRACILVENIQASIALIRWMEGILQELVDGLPRYNPIFCGVS